MAVCKQLRWFTLTVGVLVAMVVAGTASAARPMNTGVEIYSGDAGNMTANIANAFPKVSLAGAKYTRLVLVWRNVSPSPGSTSLPVPVSALDNPATYNWTTFDAYVSTAVNNGLTPLITVWQAPRWAENRTTELARAGTVRPIPAYFRAFATAAATHYRALYPTKSFAWEAWNEPNLKYFLMPQKNHDGSWHSPAMYRSLLNAFYTGIQAADPGGRVVAGSTAPFGHSGQPGALLFLRKVLCLSNLNRPVSGCGADPAHADAWSTHPYTSGGPTHHAYSPNDVSLGDLGRMHKALVAAIRSGHLKSSHAPIQFWVSEFGWDSKGPDPGGVPLSLHARWTSEALYRAWRAGVSVFIFHQLRDRPVPGYAYQAGLYFCGAAALTDDSTCEKTTTSFDLDKAKPALRAATFPFTAFAANGRITIWGRTPSSLAGKTIVIERRTRSGYRRLFTMTSNGVGIFTKRFSSRLTSGFLRARMVSPSMASVPFSLAHIRDRPAKPWGSVLN